MLLPFLTFQFLKLIPRASQHYTAVQSRPLFYKRGITNIPDAVLEQYDSILKLLNTPELHLTSITSIT